MTRNAEQTANAIVEYESMFGVLPKYVCYEDVDNARYERNGLESITNEQALAYVMDLGAREYLYDEDAHPFVVVQLVG